MGNSWASFGKPVTLSSLIQSGQAIRIPGRIDTPANRVQDSMDKANAANEQRYQQALGIYDTMLGNASNFGQLENQRLDQSVLNQSTGLDQDLFSKGLSNTTVGPSMQAGIQQQANLNRTAIADAVARQRNAILEGKAGVIERRTDLGPDLSLFSELQRLAAGAPRNSATGGGGYQPSIFGASIRMPSRGTSTVRTNTHGTQQVGDSRPRGSANGKPTAHQSQYQLSRQNRAPISQYGAAYEENPMPFVDYPTRLPEAGWENYGQNGISDGEDPSFQLNSALDDFWSSYDEDYMDDYGYI